VKNTSPSLCAETEAHLCPLLLTEFSHLFTLKYEEISMSIQTLNDRLPDYAKDLRLNLSTWLVRRFLPSSKRPVLSSRPHWLRATLT
jgi:hypothetical protein